jgi:hypothetical protein
MIERFVSTLRALLTLPVSALGDEPARALVADCADAARLELDCPQQDFTVAQRASLRVLCDALEDEGAAPDTVARAACAAAAALGIAR